MLHPFSNPGCLKIQGKDAKKFLQGQLTCDVESLAPDTLQLAAHCNPQGRVISLFYLCQHDDVFFCWMPKSMIDIALSALKKYAVFYQLNLTEADLNETNDMTNLLFNKYADIDSSSWEYSHIQQGIPIIYSETSGKFMPHELQLDKLGAVSFNKGCYTGQEIIARLHYRGKLKSQVYRVTSDALLQPGADICDQHKNVCGMVINACQHDNHSHALVLLNQLALPLFSNQHVILTSELTHVE